MNVSEYRLVKALGIVVFLALFGILVLALVKKGVKNDVQAAGPETDDLLLPPSSPVEIKPVGFKYNDHERSTLS